MKILVVNGREVRVTPHELLQILRHKYFVGYVLAALMLVMGLKPFSGLYDMDVMTTTLVFGLGGVLCLAIYFGGLLLQQKIGLRPTTILLWPIAAFSTATTVVLLGRLFEIGEATPLDLATLYLFHLAVFFVAELAFMSFILDFCLKDIRSEAADAARQGAVVGEMPADAVLAAKPPERATEPDLPVARPPAPQDSLCLFGERFDKAELWAIRAVEHYVEIKTTAGNCRLLRGQMSEAEKALPADLGFRVHRSHWVSARALKTLETGRNRWQLSLHCGAEVPVARARREETRQWVSRVLGPQD